MTKPAAAPSPHPGLGPVLRPVSVPVWAWALLAFVLFAMYVLLQENGALLTSGQAMALHEATHDARHALGVPCH